jgi:hypothetical protein
MSEDASEADLLASLAWESWGGGVGGYIAARVPLAGKEITTAPGPQSGGGRSADPSGSELATVGPLGYEPADGAGPVPAPRRGDALVGTSNQVLMIMCASSGRYGVGAGYP